MAILTEIMSTAEERKKHLENWLWCISGKNSDPNARQPLKRSLPASDSESANKRTREASIQ